MTNVSYDSDNNSNNYNNNNKDVSNGSDYNDDVFHSDHLWGLNPCENFMRVILKKSEF